MSLLAGQEMNILRYSLVCKSALINLLNKSSPVRWRIAQFMLDRINETAIHWFHLGIFFPALISQSWSPEEAVRTSKSPWSRVTYTHFLTLHWKELRLFMCSVRVDARFHFKWNQALTTPACRNTGNHGSWGSWGSATGEQGYCSRMERCQCSWEQGTWSPGALQWHEADIEAAAPSRTGS